VCRCPVCAGLCCVCLACATECTRGGSHVLLPRGHSLHPKHHGLQVHLRAGGSLTHFLLHPCHTHDTFVEPRGFCADSCDFSPFTPFSPFVFPFSLLPAGSGLPLGRRGLRNRDDRRRQAAHRVHRGVPTGLFVCVLANTQAWGAHVPLSLPTQSSQHTHTSTPVHANRQTPTHVASCLFHSSMAALDNVCARWITSVLAG
jgi:hypothetical protein